MVDRISNHLVGIAGVHHVVSELSRRGLVALPTVRNIAAYDVLVATLDGKRHANLQVKASLKRVGFFPMPPADKRPLSAILARGSTARNWPQAHARGCGIAGLLAEVYKRKDRGWRRETSRIPAVGAAPAERPPANPWQSRSDQPLSLAPASTSSSPRTTSRALGTASSCSRSAQQVATRSQAGPRPGSCAISRWTSTD